MLELIYKDQSYIFYCFILPKAAACETLGPLVAGMCVPRPGGAPHPDFSAVLTSKKLLRLNLLS